MDLAGPDIHAIVADIWHGVFRRKADEGADLLRLGVGVQRVLRLLSLIEVATGVWVCPTAALRLGTPHAIADAIVHDNLPPPSPLIMLSDGADLPPLFMVSGGGGFILEQMQLAEAIDYPGPIYGLQLRGFDGIEAPLTSIEDIAAYYLDHIYRLRPTGPYHILGYSLGGSIAAEMGHLMSRSGKEIGFIGVLDGALHESHWPASVWLNLMAERLMRKILKSRKRSAKESAEVIVRGFRSFVRRLSARTRDDKSFDPQQSPHYVAGLPSRVQLVRDSAILAYERYKPPVLNYRLTLLKSKKGDAHSCDPVKLWRKFARDLDIVEVPGSHKTMVRPPHAAISAQVISQKLSRYLPANI